MVTSTRLVVMFIRTCPIFIIIKPTRWTNFSNLFLEWNSTCFEQFLCTSSVVFHCTHSNGICHTGLLTTWCHQTCMSIQCNISEDPRKRLCLWDSIKYQFIRNTSNAGTSNLRIFWHVYVLVGAYFVWPWKFREPSVTLTSHQGNWPLLIRVSGITWRGSKLFVLLLCVSFIFFNVWQV
jgi:hypothetical protein